jgi:hypothetical protein
MKRLAAVAILGLWAAAAHAQTQCHSNPLTVALLTTGGVNAGMVTVSNDSTNIYVMFTTTGDWTIRQLDVAVGASVSNLQPDPSQFQFHQSFCPTVTTYTFTIPIPAGTAFKTSVAIEAHASLSSPTQGSQQAWGSGQLLPGSQACPTGCTCDDDGDGDGGQGGDSARHPGDNSGGGDHHCGGDLSHRAARLIPGSALNDGGGDQHCGDHHGDLGHRRKAARLAGVLHDGGQQCGGHGDGQGSVLNNGGDGGGGDGDGEGGDDEGGGGQNCGAMYFLYTVLCIFNE